MSPGPWLAAFFARLVQDRAGNVLIMTAVLMIPMIALVGSGIDIGRGYLAQSRMQQACDAASLAGRWAFSAGKDSDTATTEAVKFFNFNFRQGTLGTTPFTPTVTVTGSTTKNVAVAASTTLPRSLMQVFGISPMTIAVTCTARQDFVNTDIVLVLDTTGSMADKATSSDTQTKIQALRAAVLALYDQLYPIQQQLAAANMRLRFALVPYSMTVNAGKLLYAQNTDYIRANAYYQQCSGRNCRSYSPVIVPHSAAWLNSSSWSGCIEERQTTSSITASTTAIPAAAYDLDVDTVPTIGGSDSLRWAPYDPAAVQLSYTPQTACPAGAKRLAVWSRADLHTYLSTLNPDGGTYHDIGMIWGARMISSGGVFADSPATYNGMPTNKYMIFMTDGLLDTGLSLYGAYGVEQYDQRVTGGDLSSQKARHQQRFNLMCSRVKNMGVSIWIVGFSTALDSNLANCASNPGQASTQSNSADLISKFTQIGKNIGALRLSQ